MHPYWTTAIITATEITWTEYLSLIYKCTFWYQSLHPTARTHAMNYFAGLGVVMGQGSCDNKITGLEIWTSWITIFSCFDNKLLTVNILDEETSFL